MAPSIAKQYEGGHSWLDSLFSSYGKQFILLSLDLRSHINKFCHCISALDDWHTEDDLFNHEDFCDSLLSLFKDLGSRIHLLGGISMPSSHLCPCSHILSN